MAKIEYYFSMVSPWAFIGHDTFMDIIKTHDVDLTYHPTQLLNVFDKTGGLPMPKRHPARLAYRMLELQRWREKRNMKFDLQPAHWPYDFSNADKIIIAIQNSGVDPAAFVKAGYLATWAEGRDMADEATLTDVLARNGYDADAILTVSKSDEVSAEYDANTKAASENGYFGSPAYVLNGELFWGQDRLDLLNDALKVGRPPYKASA